MHYYISYDDAGLYQYLEKTRIGATSDFDLIRHGYFEGRYYKSQEDFTKSIDIFIGLLDQIEKSGIKDSMNYKILDELSLLYNKESGPDFVKGFEYATKSINEKIRLGASQDELAKSYSIKALLYRKVNTPQGVDSTYHYYNKSYKTFTISNGKQNVLHNLNEFKFEQDSLTNLDKAVIASIAYRKSQNVSDNSHQYFLLSKILLKKKKYDEANILLDSLMSDKSIYDKSSFYIDLVNTKLDLAKAQGIWPDDEILDSLIFNINRNGKTIIAEREMTSRLGLELENEKTRQFKFLALLIVLSLLLCGMGLIWYARSKFIKQRHKATLAYLEKSKAEAELKAIRAEMVGEQKERQQIASQLHDNLASLLTAADLHLSVAKKNDNPISLDKAKDILKDVNQQVRNLSHQLVSPSLLKFGLEPALETFINGIENDSFRINFSSDLGDKRFAETKEIFLYRSCAELLQNVQKHSNADRVAVKLQEDSGLLSLSISDNGNSNQASLEWGFGLTNIQKRAQAHNGNLEVSINEDGFLAQLSIEI
jgi:signal transduction histidine kinase